MNSATRRQFLGSLLLAAPASGWAGLSPAAAESATSFAFEPDKNIIPAPRAASDWPRFRQLLATWRDKTRKRLNYDDSLYRQAAFAWSASAFSCCFVMLCDEMFYDRQAGVYAVDSFLDHGLREFGGYDSLVLWHAYPRIGVDQRNQFDFYRDMPGGLRGLRLAVEVLQRRGVKVYIDYNPWDTGTRREGRSDLDALVELVRVLQVDGIFLDTMGKGGEEFRRRLDEVRPGVVLESEGAVPLERIYDHHASWAQHFDDSEVPGVLRHKWLERRHMQHQIRRWLYDHSGELHVAWMNGSGMMVWENVFGSWVGWNPRDRSILRSMLPIQRRYADVFRGQRWTPLVPTLQPDVYAALWEDADLRLWTLVNRADRAAEGALLEVTAVASHSYFDLLAGREIKPRREASALRLAASMAARGIGCFLSAPPAKLGDRFAEFLATQATNHARDNGNTVYPRRVTQLVAVKRTQKLQQPPEGMLVVSPRPTEELTVLMRARECGFYESNTPGQQGFGDSYRFRAQEFRRQVRLGRYAIDETPLTNAQFSRFLEASGYRPRHPENFLKHWLDGRPPAGKEDHPVVYVDLDDARAYASWAGKRLPTEEEWQYAAQGPEQREYPWGSGVQPGRCNAGETGGTTAVRAYPDGRSPCGCYDLCGNVWQWTESERSDGRTRFCIIRGGSFFAARGSNWYVDGGPRPASFATKFLLMWPGLDRCATIGFRCVVDLEA